MAGVVVVAARGEGEGAFAAGASLGAGLGGLGPSEARLVAGVGGGAIAPGPGLASTDAGTCCCCSPACRAAAAGGGDGSNPLTKLAGLKLAASSAVLCARRESERSDLLRELLSASMAVSDGVMRMIAASASSTSGVGGEGDAACGRRWGPVAGMVDMARPDGTRRFGGGGGGGGADWSGSSGAFAERGTVGEGARLRWRAEADDDERVRDAPGAGVGEAGLEACNDAALRLSGALEPLDPRGGLLSAPDGAPTPSTLLARPPGAGISGRRCKSAIMRWSDPPLMTGAPPHSREQPRRARGGRDAAESLVAGRPRDESVSAAADRGDTDVEGDFCALVAGGEARWRGGDAGGTACSSPSSAPLKLPPPLLPESDASSQSGSLQSASTVAGDPMACRANGSPSRLHPPDSYQSRHERFSSLRPFCKLSLHRVKTVLAGCQLVRMCRGSARRAEAGDSRDHSSDSESRSSWPRLASESGASARTCVGSAVCIVSLAVPGGAKSREDLLSRAQVRAVGGRGGSWVSGWRGAGRVLVLDLGGSCCC